MLNGERHSGGGSTAAPVYVATDGSVRRRRTTGFAWLASSGQYGLDGFRHSMTTSGTEVVSVTELRAIGAAVRKLRGREIILYSDSMSAVEMVTRWMDGQDVLPKRYSTYRESGKTAGLIRMREMIYEHRDKITPVWVKGHQSEPLNEGVHQLARLPSRFKLRGSDLTRAEYRLRAAELAETFSREFNRPRTI